MSQCPSCGGDCGRTAKSGCLYRAPYPTTSDDLFEAIAKRLALELECLLLSCGDTAATSRWWDSAHEALQMHRDAIDARIKDIEGRE